MPAPTDDGPNVEGRVQYNTRIRELPASERPRERLRDLGPQSLSNAELLAIIMRTGTASQSVLSLATSLLAKHQGLGGLARRSFSELKSERGVGEAKAAELLAVFTLAHRLNALQPEDRATVRSPADVMALMGGEMGFLDQEHLRVLLVNIRNQVVGIDRVYVGSVNTAQVRTAELFKEAVRQNAPSIIMVHNHPSGDPSPSAEDVALTKQARLAGEILQVEVLDHVVIGDRRFASMKQLGLGFGP
jgi:DNA repair protein RadC